SCFILDSCQNLIPLWIARIAYPACCRSSRVSSSAALRETAQRSFLLVQEILHLWASSANSPTTLCLPSSIRCDRHKVLCTSCSRSIGHPHASIRENMIREWCFGHHWPSTTRKSSAVCASLLCAFHRQRDSYVCGRLSRLQIRAICRSSSVLMARIRPAFDLSDNPRNSKPVQ